MPGSTSIETKPSPPFALSKAGRSTSHALRMSSSASPKKISVGSSEAFNSSFICSSYALPSASAFWKIDGFEVTPVTASSTIIFFSPPDSISLRESVSNQTDWPRAASSCSRDFAIFHRPFHLCDLQQARHIALPTVERRVQECAHELARQRRADNLRAEAKHVHVVVLDALVGAVGVVADRRANPRELAGCDRRANARAADEDAAHCVAALDRLAHLASLVGIVDAHRIGVGAEVENVVPGERLEHGVPQVDATMVEGGRDLHATRSRSATARATTLSRL